MKRYGPLIALVVSAIIHGGAVAALLLMRPLEPKPTASAPMTLVLIDSPAKAPSPPEAAPTQATPPQPAPKPRPAPRVRPEVALATPPTVPTTPAPQPASPPPPTTPQQPQSDARRAQTDVPRDVPRELPKLSITAFSGSEQWLGVDAGVEVIHRGLRGVGGPSDTLIADLAKDAIGRGKVDRGLVHPYYVQLGKKLIALWDADRSVSKGGLKGYTQQFAENSKIYNEIWLDRAAAYGRSGSPLSGSSTPSPNRRVGVANDRVQGFGTGVDLEARKELQRELREAYKATRRATIRVVQDAGGKLKSVELVEPSNDDHVDREALADVRSAAEKLPAPPAEVTNGKDRITSLWSFELIISISPPVPTVTFEFDEALGFIDARLPLDRRIYKKVRLVSVED